MSFDESVQLEPNQVAGFNQVFRSIISESVVGSVAAPDYETAGLLGKTSSAPALMLARRGRCCVGGGARDRHVRCAHRAALIIPPIIASSTPQQLDYEEQNLILSCNQLLGEEWSLGARYQLTLSDLRRPFAKFRVGDAA